MIDLSHTSHSIWYIFKKNYYRKSITQISAHIPPLRCFRDVAHNSQLTYGVKFNVKRFCLVLKYDFEFDKYFTTFLMTRINLQ